MMSSGITHRYHEYVACLNNREWDMLKDFVSEDIRYNDKSIGLASYCDMLKSNCRDIPDLKFTVGMIIADGANLASRLLFDCVPTADFMGLAVNGQRVTFSENVFYVFDEGRIKAVWSVVDKAAIEAQLRES